jgi:hypothetical protein
LAAVTYYTDLNNQDSVLLRLATTNEDAPRESIHVKWCNLGLSTYLLCMLLKQHTGRENSMDNSVLSVQVSTDPAELHASRFFQRLGFKKLMEEDNGLAMTPKAFQENLFTFSTYWVSPSKERRYLFQLHGGKLLLPNFNTQLSLFNDPMVKGPKDSDFYVKFPWPARSMKAIETCLKDLPVLESLSGKSLPKKDLPFSYIKASSKIAGAIYEKDRSKYEKTSQWLSDMDIHILCAFLLRNRTANQFVHVIGPAMTTVIQQVFEDKVQFDSKEAPTADETYHYHKQLQHFYKYIDTC